MASLPTRCLVKDLRNDRELILPISAVLVRNLETGLLRTATKAEIESNVPLYMQSGESVVEVEMIYYAETKQKLLSLQRSSGDKRIQIKKKLSLTPCDSGVRKMAIPAVVKKKLPSRKTNEMKQSLKKIGYSVRDNSVTISDNAVIRMIKRNKENINVLGNISDVENNNMNADLLSTHEDTSSSVVQALTHHVLRETTQSVRDTLRETYEKTSLTPSSQASQISTPFSTSRRRSNHENSPQTSHPHSSSRSRSNHKDTPRTLGSQASQISTPFSTSRRRSNHENSPQTSHPHSSSRSRSNHKDIRRTLGSQASQDSTLSSRRRRRSNHENSLRTSHPHSSSRSRSNHEDTPRTSRPHSSGAKTRFIRETRRSTHEDNSRTPRSDRSNVHTLSSRNSSDSYHSSTSSDFSDVDEIVNQSQLRKGFSIFRKKIVADVIKVLRENNSERPSSTKNGKVKIEGIILDAKNFLRALLAKKMSLRAKRLMRAYWTEDIRDRLIIRKNKKFPHALIVTSQNYNDLISLCYALQKTRFLKHRKENNPEHNMYRWVIDFLKNDRAHRKKQKGIRPRARSV